MTSASFSL